MSFIAELLTSGTRLVVNEIRGGIAGPWSRPFDRRLAGVHRAPILLAEISNPGQRVLIRPSSVHLVNLIVSDRDGRLVIEHKLINLGGLHGFSEVLQDDRQGKHFSRGEELVIEGEIDQKRQSIIKLSRVLEDDPLNLEWEIVNLPRFSDI